jgi:transposase-like protein
VPSGQPYEPARKAQAIAALTAGEPVHEVARSTGIPLGTLRKWRQEHGGSLIESHEKKAELGELVADYLEEVLTTLASQARHARESEWLNKQNAADLAIYHGVLTDKAIRILAALQPVEEPEPEGEG